MASYIINSDELYHHGIKGQKWGVRRYQNSDGSLTKKGRKRISKEYKKAQMAGDKELSDNYNKLYVEAYNKSADTMNNGGIDKFNKKQQKKYGKDYAQRDDYFDDYEKEFSKLVNKNLNKKISDFVDSNANYQKAKNFVKQYDMTKWDDLAKQNSEAYNSFHAK